jgi:DNA-binding CsgD family transcriptional regulator
MNYNPAIFRRAKLNKKQREALAWWLCDGYSYQEIGEWHCCSWETARDRVKRAVEKLEAIGITVPARTLPDPIKVVNFTDLRVKDTVGFEEMFGGDDDRVTAAREADAI